MNAFNRSVARVLIVCTLGLGMPMPASAGIVSTDQVVAATQRDEVRLFLDRAEVRDQMRALGVDPRAVRERVDALSEDEVASLASRLDQLPAGGSDVLGVLLVIFVILLLTDILGFTKIFPFTRSVK